MSSFPPKPKPANIYHADRVQQFRQEVIDLAKEIYVHCGTTSATGALEQAYNFMTYAKHFKDTGDILSMINIEERYDH